MIARPLLLCAATSLLACACSTPRPQGQAKDFEATIASIVGTDPGSPAVLSAQLAYAEFLLSRAPGSCMERLERVQQQLGSVDENPNARVLFPDGWARATDFEYRLYLARADCGSETNRRNELLTALAAAGRAVELYRNALDYRSMVVMQFDVATVLHQLGENAASLAALEMALNMDREYGFEEAARDHYKLLLTWRGEPAGDAQIAGLMQDFPKRRVVLTFGWRPRDARVTLESRREYLADGQIVTTRAAATFERHVRVSAAREGGWRVSHAHRLTRYKPGVWPTMPGSQTPQTVFLPGAAPPADFNVSATGEFQGVTDDINPFVAHLIAKTKKLIRADAPSDYEALILTSEAVEEAAATFTPGMLEAATAESYQLETAMWIGATLEQGVWYEASAPLTLPGVPRLVVQNHIECAFTRMVPCTAGTAAQTCVEMVIRAIPDQDALNLAITDVGLAAYTASTEARIVTDPTTLFPYAREERLTWYASNGKGRGNSVLGSEHLVCTMAYDPE